MTTNPLMQASALPYELPPFADIEPGHFPPAFEAGMSEQLAEIAAITANGEAPTFDNTVAALERSGRLLERATALFHNNIAAIATPHLRALESEYSPRLAAHDDAITLDRALLARIEHVRHDRAALTPEQDYLVERLYRDFVLAGARLDDDGQIELRQLNRAIAELATEFDQRLETAMEAHCLVVDTEAELAGMSADDIAAAAGEAAERGHPGKYLLALKLPTSQPALAVLSDRETRRKLFDASVDRAVHGVHDTGPLAIDLAQLRARKAQLLGFASYADLALADQTARTTGAVDALLDQLAPAVAHAAADAELLQSAADRDGVRLEPWDWAFYAERVRAERFAVDTTALRPYFELDRVLLDGVLFAANRLYGLTFTPRPDLPGYHPDVRVWEVFDEAGAALGLFLADYFARPGKRGGAWMNPLVVQSHLLDTLPVVVNNLNVARPAVGEPTLLTLDETRTLFHEFGHALHGLLSDVTYPRLSGTDVPNDFVEYPSQVNEMWMYHPEVLANYARHVDTGAPLDDATADALRRARSWGPGFRTVEMLAATRLDQAWHRIAPDEVITEAGAFEVTALQQAGLATPLIPPRYRSSYFHHIFGGPYSARYYSYLWSEVLDADTVQWFEANGGLSRAAGERFRRELLGVGGSTDPLEAFRTLTGSDPDVGPLLARFGLTHS